jgi:hypothetical protein
MSPTFHVYIITLCITPTFPNQTFVIQTLMYRKYQRVPKLGMSANFIKILQIPVLVPASVKDTE